MSLYGTAHKKVSRAVACGTLVRPETCDECGEQRRIIAHHEDYGKPLEVDWLCDDCHVKRHRGRRKARNHDDEGNLVAFRVPVSLWDAFCKQAAIEERTASGLLRYLIQKDLDEAEEEKAA